MQSNKKTAVCVLGNSDKVSGVIRFTQEAENGPTQVKVSIKGLAPGILRVFFAFTKMINEIS